MSRSRNHSRLTKHISVTFLMFSTFVIHGGTVPVSSVRKTSHASIDTYVYNTNATNAALSSHSLVVARSQRALLQGNVELWKQCGGKSNCPEGAPCNDSPWATCVSGGTCFRQSEWNWHCVPESSLTAHHTFTPDSFADNSCKDYLPDYCDDFARLDLCRAKVGHGEGMTVGQLLCKQSCNQCTIKPPESQTPSPAPPTPTSSQDYNTWQPSPTTPSPAPPTPSSSTPGPSPAPPAPQTHSNPPGDDLSPISGGHSGNAVTTRYWDCCKPSCGWHGKASVTNPVKSCSADDAPLDYNVNNVCTSSDGTAFRCTNQQAWAVSDNLAYGFAAAKLAGKGEGDWCCACYKLKFTDGSAVGKEMVVQVTNTGSDLTDNHFDIAIPDGNNQGLYQGCSKQYPGYGTEEIHGSSAHCSQLPEKLQPGCRFRFEWGGGFSNPTVSFQQVKCPAALVERSGCKRLDE